MRLIDADELKTQFSSEEPYGPEEIKGIIDNAPTVHDTINLYPSGEVIIQQTRPQGKWVGLSAFLQHKEELTGERYSASPYYDGSLYCNHCWVAGGTKKTNFCPNCGAAMQEGETNG